MTTPKYTKEQEIMILKQAWNMLSSLSVTGPKQAGILAQAADHIIAVINSLGEELPKESLNGEAIKGADAVV